MDDVLSYTNKTVKTTTAVGYVLGLLGLSFFAVTQFLSALLPLLFGPLIFGVYVLVLVNAQPNKRQLMTVTSPTTVVESLSNDGLEPIVAVHPDAAV